MLRTILHISLTIILSPSSRLGLLTLPIYAQQPARVADTHTHPATWSYMDRHIGLLSAPRRHLIAADSMCLSSFTFIQPAPEKDIQGKVVR